MKTNKQNKKQKQTKSRKLTRQEIDDMMSNFRKSRQIAKELGLKVRYID